MADFPDTITSVITGAPPQLPANTTALVPYLDATPAQTPELAPPWSTALALLITLLWLAGDGSPTRQTHLFFNTVHRGAAMTLRVLCYIALGSPILMTVVLLTAMGGMMPHLSPTVPRSARTGTVIPAPASCILWSRGTDIHTARGLRLQVSRTHDFGSIQYLNTELHETFADHPNTATDPDNIYEHRKLSRASTALQLFDAMALGIMAVAFLFVAQLQTHYM